MTPAARLQAAIDILDAWAPGRPMDRLLVSWRRANRYAGSGDRAAIADLVYDALRRWRSLAWPAAGEGAGDGGRARILALAAETGDPEALFSGARHAPAPLTDHERERLAERAERGLIEAPDALRLDLPDWLPARFRAAHGPDAEAVMDSLHRRAPVDLRVNRLKATPEAAIASLAAQGVFAAPVALASGPATPDALRVSSGGRGLKSADAYLDGWVEVQDVASQAAAAFAHAQPGERVLDYCAGGGGKALALAAAMDGQGEIVAHDVDPARMQDLGPRAARAGVRIETLPGPVPASARGGFDLVFVDAPCSGSGAWRRNPDAKWGFTPQALDRLTAIQAEVLAEAAAFVRPGGRLVYATCSLLGEENRDRVQAFLPGSGFALEEELSLTPLDGGDGFYAARLARNSG
ncbi:RsmB/NOP family class I SAM-dependent RNA methyltransferase [Albimonas sp. CAU 1670]|uniref:RsmB/NOP family class I SAM-dependent RNA methyltransferase n=1 Tax=Albimonas sp. CAU 1670 TaxID=3032599 RepID=UPI0023DCDECA|nr:RsmB/NOP family class I SAM-dependent RNA methyltransferase [Albimonas sp. CAU 1670]MDF2232672.1 RsmB/NOP family class I SAM-dependent RNA methyltransferase [Albimonas sp. CAU 1670]